MTQPVLTVRERVRRHRSSITLGNQTFDYCPGKIIPETIVALRGVLREVDRLWCQYLGDEVWNELRNSPECRIFFEGIVRLEPVPPNREMVTVRLPLPADYLDSLRPQLIDAIEPDDLP